MNYVGSPVPLNTFLLPLHSSGGRYCVNHKYILLYVYPSKGSKRVKILQFFLFQDQKNTDLPSYLYLMFLKLERRNCRKTGNPPPPDRWSCFRKIRQMLPILGSHFRRRGPLTVTGYRAQALKYTLACNVTTSISDSARPAVMLSDE